MVLSTCPPPAAPCRPLPPHVAPSRPLPPPVAPSLLTVLPLTDHRSGVGGRGVAVKSTSGSDVFPEGGPANALMHYKVFVPSYIKLHIILLHIVLYYYVNPPLSPHRRHAPSVDRSRPLVTKGGSPHLGFNSGGMSRVRGQKRSFWRS